MLPGLILLLIIAGPFSATAKVAPGPYFVGQGIEVRVEAKPPGESLKLEFLSPTPTGFEVFKAGADGFVVVPRMPGTIEIPAFRARVGDRSASTAPIRLSVAAIPGAGRSAAFLGGVGSFDVSADVKPRSIRLGETVEYRITLTGPAAWGSARAPSLSAWTAIRVEPTEPELVAENPPRRTFVYRLRPTKAGKVVLPPVSVASYVSKAAGFSTKSTASVSVDVIAPTRFDPNTVNYGSAEASEPAPGIGSLGAASLVLAVLVFWLVGRRSWARRAAVRRVAAEIAAELDPSWSEVEAARRITQGFARYLEVSASRPPGVLTPPEAREAIDRLTGDRDLAHRVGVLIERCDGVWFGGRGSPAMVTEAREILSRLDKDRLVTWKDWLARWEAVSTA